ncbi:hypothetical protein DVH24_025557 [Malus domestica]|uniref:Protein kinase domain-containing protein n=1 Tax=Malus domestica TaxID=3750 RepID=A0A498HKP6_MALDO|nr:hypothetical protein DVH24_025557 [Malus domestica]
MQAEAAAGEVSEVRNSVINSISNDDSNSNRMENEEWSLRPIGERRRYKPNPRLSNPPMHLLGEQVAAGWPSTVAGEAINGWTPRRAHTFEKIDKIGQGMYSNVYKARDLLTGKIVAPKKVRFDNLEPESVRFMAREILILHRLDHPNVVKLEGLVTSRMSCTVYLVFEYMEHDLAGLAASPAIKFTEPQVEQLHKIFKLCGSPSEEYWRKSRLPHATLFKPQQSYKGCIAKVFKDFPPSSLLLIETLLAIDPAERRTATAALRNELFTTKPYACEPSSLPKYPPRKEMLSYGILRAAGRDNADHVRKSCACDRKGIPAPEANAERQGNLDRQRLITHANVKSKSEKFPPPHQDGTLGYPLGSSDHIVPAFDPLDVSFSSTSFAYSEESVQTWSGPLVKPAAVGAPATLVRTNSCTLEALKERLKGTRIVCPPVPSCLCGHG